MTATTRLEVAADWGARDVYQYEQRARRLEGAGFDCIWITNSHFFEDLWMSATLAARVTEHVDIGTFVLDPYSSHPLTVATQVATLSKIAGERVRVGVGAGGIALRALGIERSRPAAAIPQFVHRLRGLLELSGSPTITTEYGPVYQTAGPYPSVPLKSVPVIEVASRGRKVLANAATVADRLQIASISDADALRTAIKLAVPEVDKTQLAARVDVAVGDTVSAACDAIRGMVGLSIANSFPDTWFLDCLGWKYPESLREELAARGVSAVDRIASELPESVVQRTGICGPLESVTERIKELLNVVAAVVIVPHPCDQRDVDRDLENLSTSLRS